MLRERVRACAAVLKTVDDGCDAAVAWEILSGACVPRVVARHQILSLNSQLVLGA